MAITVTHDSIEIAYDESENRWKFELRGRSRSAESLAKAKEAIVGPAPASKRPFARFTAYLRSYSSVPTKVEITSVAEMRFGKASELWIVDGGGKRSKENIARLFAVTSENEAIIAEVETARGKVKTINAEIEANLALLTGITQLLGDAAQEETK